MENGRLYFNRELSWLEFNYRVLEEALNENNPLLERLKFISIFSSNLDEFFQVRISGLVSQIKENYSVPMPSGDMPEAIVNELSIKIKEYVTLQYDCFHSILEKLSGKGIIFYNSKNIPGKYIDYLKDYFDNKIFLMLTPMAIDNSHPFPFLSSKSLNILVTLKKQNGDDNTLYSVIPLPIKERFIKIPNNENKAIFISIEELVRLFIDSFYVGYKVEKTSVFRITRDAEIPIDEEDSNLLTAIEMGLKLRERGYPLRLEFEANTDKELLNYLYDNIDFFKGFNYDINGPLDLSSFMDIALINGFDELKAKPILPLRNYRFKDEDQSIFDIIKEKDVLLFHPFESFDPVINFLEEASNDPKVLAIKITLYRTSGDSPIIKSLKKAVDNGKQVTAIVEVKARFDEARNITWAKILEEAGCHVVYGVVGLKVHCKIALVVREEEDGIKRYLHLSTGNYNDKTAKLYTDIGFFTCKKSFGQDASSIFNLLTGYSEPQRWKKIISAPLDLRDFFIEKINREKQNVKNGGTGKIIAKMNALIDIKIINELYDASKCGVEIILVVRGMCRLIPGLKDISENIKVISIVDQLLEHSRIYYFYNSGDEEFYLASADWMERNLDKRVELLFPIEEEELKNELKNVLNIILRDNVKARILHSDGKYRLPVLKEGEKPHRSQHELYDFFKNKNLKNEKKEFKFIPNTKE